MACRSPAAPASNPDRAGTTGLTAPTAVTGRPRRHQTRHLRQENGRSRLRPAGRRPERYRQGALGPPVPPRLGASRNHRPSGPCVVLFRSPGPRPPETGPGRRPATRLPRPALPPSPVRSSRDPATTPRRRATRQRRTTGRRRPPIGRCRRRTGEPCRTRTGPRPRLDPRSRFDPRPRRTQSRLRRTGPRLHLTARRLRWTGLRLPRVGPHHRQAGRRLRRTGPRPCRACTTGRRVPRRPAKPRPRRPSRSVRRVGWGPRTPPAPPRQAHRSGRSLERPQPTAYRVARPAQSRMPTPTPHRWRIRVRRPPQARVPTPARRPPTRTFQGRSALTRQRTLRWQWKQCAQYRSSTPAAT
jgi:hypothetical protein